MEEIKSILTVSDVSQLYRKIIQSFQILNTYLLYVLATRYLS